jgi:hypothetical protein
VQDGRARLGWPVIFMHAAGFWSLPGIAPPAARAGTARALGRIHMASKPTASRTRPILRVTVFIGSMLLACGWLLVAAANAQAAEPAPALGAAEQDPTAVPAGQTAAPGAEPSSSPEPFTILRVEPPAQPPSAPPARRPHAAFDDEDPPSDDDREWYGWQTLSVDGASIAMIAGGGESGSPALSVVGIGGLLIGAPIVHAVHRNHWALPSLGMRLGSAGLMTAGAFLSLSCISYGEAEPSSCSSEAPIGYAFMITGMLGAIASIGVDAVLARSPRKDREAASFGLWGDPRTGVAGVSVTMVR